jgi:hypothetical protein
MRSESAASIERRRAIVFFVLLFCIEVSVFYAQVSMQITPFYPMNFDQTTYINQVYTLYARFVDVGWLSLVQYPFKTANSSGMGLQIQGALAAIVGGPNRISLLSVNLFYFLTLQLALFKAIRSTTGSTAFSWIGVALLISCLSIFDAAGGLFDFRIDFSALCLFGIWICLIVMSRTFRDRRLAFAAGLIASLLIVTRFVTLVYIALIYATIIVALTFGARTSTPVTRAFSRYRIRNVWQSFLLVALFAGLPLSLSIIPIYQKYVGAHVLSNEKYMRATEVGVHDLIGHVLFYPRSIVFDHIGAPALCLSAGLVLALSVATIVNPNSRKTLGLRLIHYRYEFIAIALAIAVPIAVLTMDIAKSTVVGGIVVVPIILAFIILVSTVRSEDALRMVSMKTLSWGRGPKPRADISVGSNINLLGLTQAVVMLSGLLIFLSHASVRQHAIPRVDLDHINELNGAIVRYAVEHDMSKPRFSIDRIVDYLYWGTLDLTAFERFNVGLSVTAGLGDAGNAFDAVPRAVAIQLVEASDILVLTDPSIGRDSPYPLNSDIKSYWNDLMSWAKEHRWPLYKTNVREVPYEVFVRPEFRVTGISTDGWITEAGFTIEADVAQLKQWPYIFLGGEATFNELQGVPSARATVMNAGSADQELPAALSSRGSRYELIVDTRALPANTATPIRILVTFDRSFVPQKLGINSDTRHLVVRAPTSKEMMAAASN